MIRLNNPFVVYGYKGSKYFCDREKETENIINGLNNERNITLIAPRRIGKTGLIQHVFQEIEIQMDVKCFYIDIFPTKDMKQLVQLLAKTIIGKLDTPSQSTLRKISDFFSNCRPTVTFDPLTGLPTVSLDFKQSEGEQTLKQIFEYLKLSGKRCYIAIDEFQQITEYPEKGTEALLRSYIQFLPNVYFIFAGSQQHLMSEMFMSAKRPFYLSSQIVKLDRIDEKIYYDFANSFFNDRDIILSSKSFHYLYNMVDGQTWYVQAILNRLYSTADNNISNEDIDVSIKNLIGEQEMVFQNYYASLTFNQSTLLLAIAKEGIVEEPLSQSFISQYELPAVSSVSMALKALLSRQMIYKNIDGYIVYDRFFGLWLKSR